MATKTIVKYRRAPKAKHHHKAGMTVPLGVVAGFMPLAMFAYDGFQYGGWTNVGHRLLAGLTGYNTTTHKFESVQLKNGLYPLLAGLAAHKIVGQWLGVNRMLAKAKIPFIRI